MSTDKAYFSGLAAIVRAEKSLTEPPPENRQASPSPTPSCHDEQKAVKKQKRLQEIGRRFGVSGNQAEEIYQFERQCAKNRRKENPDLSKEAAKTFGRQDACLRYGHLIREKHAALAFEK